MTPLRAVPERLSVRLASVLGRQSAAQELRWMRELKPSDAELSQMVERRLRGEPLQYILGPCFLILSLPVDQQKSQERNPLDHLSYE